jgi:pyruvate dehydrogenase E2 component (dihydrolipoamide acetyltransferase)
VTVSKVVLAKLSPTMEEGTIVKWSKQEGEPVKIGDVLAEIETDKANMEMEALGAGVLRKILVPAGGKAPVGALIGVVAEPGEDISALLAQAPAAAQPQAPQPETAQPQAQPMPAAKPQPQPAPTAPAPPAAEAAAQSPPAQAAQPSSAPSTPSPPPPEPAPAMKDPEAPGAPPAAATAPAAPSEPEPASSAPQPGAGAVAPPVAPAPAGEGRVKASPLARNMAAERNIPLTAVAGSGPGGRVIRRDIEGWSAPAPPPAGSSEARRPAGGAPTPSVTPGQEIPLSSMRKTIAKRLSESKFTAPHYYVSMDIDMDAAVAAREQLLRGENVKISFNDLVVKACARALTRFPTVNASWAGDKIVTHAEVHVGVAVALPDGLITPVVRHADRKSVLGIGHEVKELAGRAREKKLRPEDYSGSTFTVSNLGMYDVTEFTAIINPPESCILAVGAVRKLPVAVGDQVRVGHRMRVTLSSDHRVVDGAVAAQFLQEVRRLLESPISLLL